MKALLYIFGITGGLALVLRIIGIFMEFPFNRFLFVGGMVSVGLTLLLGVIHQVQYNRKIKNIIEESKGKKADRKTIKQEKTKVKGWDMNNSPFRERKSGLTWGGGNIKGANASRGTKRSFLK